MNAKHLYGDELLYLLLCLWHQRQGKRIPYTVQEIINGLYACSQIPELEPLFINYAFDVDGLEPSSRALDDAVEHLLGSMIIDSMTAPIIIDNVAVIYATRYVYPKLQLLGHENLADRMFEAFKKAVGPRRTHALTAEEAASDMLKCKSPGFFM